MITRTQSRARVQSGVRGARRGATTNNQGNIPYNDNHGGYRGNRGNRRSNNGYGLNTNNHYNQRRGSGESGQSYSGENQHAKNDNSSVSPLWRTFEDRERYTENLGVSGPSRNRSYQESPFREQLVSGRGSGKQNQNTYYSHGNRTPFTNNYDITGSSTEDFGFNGQPRSRSLWESSSHEQQALGRGGGKQNQYTYNQRNRTASTSTYDITGMTAEDFICGRGNRRGRRAQQDLRPSALQLSNQGRAQIMRTEPPLRPVRTSTTNRLGNSDNPTSVTVARDLKQEEYDLQAAEYAAKNREKEIQKLQEKMMRLRFCSAYDLGHRLRDDSTRDLSPEARERMVQKLQDDYNEQAKEHAKHMKEIEKKKEALETAKKLEKYDRSPLYKEMSGTQLGSARASESTGAVPKHKAYNSSFEKKKKPRVDVKVAADSVKHSPTTTFKSITLNGQALDMEKALNVLCKPSSSTSHVPPVTESVKKPAVDWTKYNPTAEDNLREVRRKMQEKLDRELALKKEEEGKQKAVCVKNALPKNNTDVPQKSILQKPLTKVKEVNLPKERKNKEEAKDLSFAAPTGLQIDFKELEHIHLPGFNTKVIQSEAKNNPVLVLRPLEEKVIKKADCVHNSLPKNDTIVSLKSTAQKPSKKEEGKQKAVCVQNALPKNNTNVPQKSILQKPLTKTQNILGTAKPVEQNNSVTEIVKVKILEQLVPPTKGKSENQAGGGAKKSAGDNNDKRMEANVANGNIKNKKEKRTMQPSDCNSDAQIIEPNNAAKLEEQVISPIASQNQKEALDKPGDSTKTLSLLDQLKLRAERLEKEYEENFAHQFQPSLSGSDCNKDKEKQIQPVSALKPKNCVSQPAQNEENEIAWVPVILNCFQLNEYDRTGVLPKITDHFRMGNKLFTTHGSDYLGQPVLKLRVN